MRSRSCRRDRSPCVLACSVICPISGSSGKSPDTREDRDPRPTTWPVPPPPAPDERVTVPVPVRRRLLDRPADLRPGLEPPTLQRQTLEHLPPRLDQV